MDGEAWRATVHGVAKSRTQLSDFTFTFFHFHFSSKEQHLLISWLQSPSAVTLEPKKIKSLTAFIVSHLFDMKLWDQIP